MTGQTPSRCPKNRSNRPRATTVFAAAFLAGAAAAVGVNRSLDVHLAQRQPRVESEPIFVALRPLPQGVPVTVWDVALRDWPKAMLPAAAMRPRDSFEGMVLRHPVREGQPILSVQLAKADATSPEQVADAVIAAPAAIMPQEPQPDLWAPAEAPSAAATPEQVSDVAVTTPPEASGSPAAETPPAPPAADPTVVAAIPEPVVASPVVVATPSSTDIDPVVAAVDAPAEAAIPQPQESVSRYLVVPERIALEADRSFALAPQPAPQSSVVPNQAGGAPAAAGPQGRTTKSSDRTSSNRDRQMQRPPRSASSPPSSSMQRGGAWSLRSMMPTLSLGMGAAEPGSPHSGDKPGTATHQPRSPSARGFGLFR